MSALFIQVHYYNTMDLNHGHSQIMGHLQKEGLWLNPDTPKTIFSLKSTYKLPQKLRSYQS